MFSIKKMGGLKHFNSPTPKFRKIILSSFLLLCILPIDSVIAAPDEIVLHTNSASLIGSRWTLAPDATAASGVAIFNANLSEAKVPGALPSPLSYTEINFTALAGVKYHVWLRMKAHRNDYSNDSVYVQFSDSLNSSNLADYRIGTNKALTIILEEGSGSNVSGWGWNDAGYGTLGANISFANSGNQTIRIQQREDGTYIDQIVLSPVNYLAASPGLTKNDATILPATQLTSPTPAPAPDPAPAPNPNPGPSGNFKIASWNIKSGQGVCMPNTPCPFDEQTQNCTATSLPLNAWGYGIPQKELAKLNADPSVVALGLQEAWGCGNPTNVKNSLGWAYQSGELNGVALIARYGILGSLSTKLVSIPGRGEPRYVFGADVCLNVGCTSTVRVYVTHLGALYGEATATTPHIDGDIDIIPQVENLTTWINSQPSPTKHVLVGDFNMFDMEPTANYACEPDRNSPALPYLRNVGYTDTWKSLYGNALGMTGMMNRSNCGPVSGTPYKRIDYSWSKGLVPVSMTFIGNVPAATPAPSDHLGVLAEYSTTGTVPAPTVNPIMPPSLTLTTSTSTVSPGSPVTLTWTSANASTLTLDNTPVALSGSTVVYPTTNKVYKLAGTNQGGTTYTTVYVGVSAGATPTPPPPTSTTTTDIIIRPGQATSSNLVGTRWTVISDVTAALGKALHNPDLSQAKVSGAMANPTSYAEFSFTAVANVNYHLWLRMKAQNDSYSNDSVFVQFSDSLNTSGLADYRIGTTKALDVILEDGSGKNVLGWGWADNGYGTLGTHIKFETSGTHTIRIQQREDGPLIDQIVLSPVTWLTSSPGSLKSDNVILP